MIKADSAGRADLQLQLLVLRCQAGDESAFAQLFDRFAPRTLAHLRSFVGDDAEDVQQEVWLAVYRSLRGLSNPGAFRTWLFRTTRHRAIDFLRRRKRELELIEETTIATETKEPADDDFGSIDDNVLNETLAELPVLQREALLLRYRDDMSYAEIALVTGCPIGTVRTRLHHAKRQLQERFRRDTQ